MVGTGCLFALAVKCFCLEGKVSGAWVGGKGEYPEKNPTAGQADRCHIERMHETRSEPSAFFCSVEKRVF